MNLEPLIHAPAAIRVHVTTILPAFIIGTWLIFFSPKGTRVHRAGGYLYVALLAAASISAMFIHEVSPGNPLGLSPIHLFVPLTAYALYRIILGARTHNLTVHRRGVMISYFGAIVIAGLFTLLPGRIMHQVLLT